MQIDIYEITNQGRGTNDFISVPAGASPADITLPKGVTADSLKLFRRGVELDAGPLVALNTADVKAQIEAKGYARHGTKVVVKEVVVEKLPPDRPAK